MLILTTDFFTPVVDEPYDFGAIAAASGQAAMITAITAAASRPNRPAPIKTRITKLSDIVIPHLPAAVPGDHDSPH